MIRNLRKILSGAAILISGAVSAQDIHFSQFYMSPLNLNPALTGVMNCNVRVTGIYRNQWASVLRSNSFKTFGASYDQKIPVGREDYFGVGGNLWADKAGESNFSTISGQLSGSYSKKMGGYRDQANYLVAGVQLGASQRSIDFLKIKWGSQHNGDGTWNPNLPSQENFTRDRFVFADVSVGLLWFSVLDKHNSFYAGAAFSHLNKPNQSFEDGPVEALYNKATIHAGGEFRLTDGLALVPGLVTFFQGPSFETNFGTSFRFLLAKDRFNEQNFQLGAWMRLANHYEKSLTGDALILSTRFDYNQFSLGFSYDFNISPLAKASNGNGAFEFSLMYLICGPEKRGVYCPRF